MRDALPIWHVQLDGVDRYIAAPSRGKATWGFLRIAQEYDFWRSGESLAGLRTRKVDSAPHDRAVCGLDGLDMEDTRVVFVPSFTTQCLSLNCTAELPSNATVNYCSTCRFLRRTKPGRRLGPATH